MGRADVISKSGSADTSRSTGFLPPNAELPPGRGAGESDRLIKALSSSFSEKRSSGDFGRKSPSQLMILVRLVEGGALISMGMVAPADKSMGLSNS